MRTALTERCPAHLRNTTILEELLLTLEADGQITAGEEVTRRRYPTVHGYCGTSKKVVIPEGVTSIGDCAFKDCGSLTSVVIPGNVTSIGEEVFRMCKQISDFTCPSTFIDELPNILPKTKHTIALHPEDITDISAKYRPGAAVGFAEDGRDCTDENGKNTVSTSNPTPSSWSDWPPSILPCST